MKNVGLDDDVHDILRDLRYVTRKTNSEIVREALRLFKEAQKHA